MVVIHGKAHYLERYDSPESWEKYHRLLAEFQAPTAAGPIPMGPARTAFVPTIDELLLDYWARRVEPYYRKDGRPTSEQGNIRQTLRFLRRLYGHTPAADFGPLSLKAVRQAMIRANHCRRLINKNIRLMLGEWWPPMSSATPR